MIKRLIPVSSILFCWLTVSGCAQNEESPNDSLNVVNVESGKAYVLESPKVAGSWQVQVSLPVGYDQSVDNYPVVYVLHGGFYFNFAVSALRRMTVFGDIPEVIIVGISNESNGQFAYGTNRADQFLDFMESKVFPLVEENFRTHRDRTLLGWHYTAGFAFHTLLNRPDMFKYYIPASPYLQGYDLSTIEFETLSKFSSTIPDSTKYLYFGALSNERSVTEAALGLDSLFKQQSFANLEVEFHLIGPDNSDGIELSVFRLWPTGLKRVYAPYQAQILNFQSLEHFQAQGGLEALNKHAAERSLQFGGTSVPVELISLIRLAERADDFLLFEELMTAYGNHFEHVNLNVVMGFAAFYLKHGQAEKAIAIYSNVNSMYPNSVSVYRDMGQAFLEADQHERAIESYKTAIELAEEQKDSRLSELQAILSDLN